jgi:hypothetical protein
MIYVARHYLSGKLSVSQGGGAMNWLTLNQVWKLGGCRKNLKVRFSDWSHQIKYFTVKGESSDGKRLLGILSTGEKISFPKRSRGWEIYYPESEFMAKAV